MENLIQKAIQAIVDGKTERAIGLLEGALEMKGVNVTHKVLSRDQEAAQILDGGFKTTYTHSDEQEEIPAHLRPGAIGTIHT